jgi:hypothetical protein
MVAIETTQYVEVESETAEAAIESVKSQLNPRVAAAAAFQVVQELTYDEESSSYKML